MSSAEQNISPNTLPEQVEEQLEREILRIQADHEAHFGIN